MRAIWIIAVAIALFVAAAQPRAQIQGIIFATTNSAPPGGCSAPFVSNAGTAPFTTNAGSAPFQTGC